MFESPTDSLNLWWVIAVGTGIALALAFGFILVLFFGERSKRKIEREKASEIEHLLHESENMRKELANLSQKMMDVQEEDRLRISRELHDEVGQTLTAIQTNLQIVAQDLPPSQNGFHDRLAESQTLAKEVTQRIRRVIRELRPIDFTESGLIPSLEKYISEFEARSGVRTIFRHDPLEEELSLNHKVTIFRIVQESLTNIARHSGASEAQVSLLEKVELGDGDGEAAAISTYLEIRDNGGGMNPNGQRTVNGVLAETTGNHDGGHRDENSGGIGLVGIQERVKLLSGKFQVTSSPLEGTKIIVKIPRNGI